MQRVLLATIALIALLFASGCAHQAGGVSPSTIPLEPGSYTELGEVSGSDCVTAFLFIPLSDGNLTKRAVADALSKNAQADALVNLSVDTYGRSFILFNQTCTEVFGTAVKSN